MNHDRIKHGKLFLCLLHIALFVFFNCFITPLPIQVAADPSIVIGSGNATAQWNFTTQSNYTLDNVFFMPENVSLNKTAKPWLETDTQAEFDLGTFDNTTSTPAGDLRLAGASSPPRGWIKNPKFTSISNWTYNDGNGGYPKALWNASSQSARLNLSMLEQTIAGTQFDSMDNIGGWVEYDVVGNGDFIFQNSVKVEGSGSVNLTFTHTTNNEWYGLANQTGTWDWSVYNRVFLWVNSTGANDEQLRIVLNDSVIQWTSGWVNMNAGWNQISFDITGCTADLSQVDMFAFEFGRTTTTTTVFVDDIWLDYYNSINDIATTHQLFYKPTRTNETVFSPFVKEFTPHTFIEVDSEGRSTGNVDRVQEIDNKVQTLTSGNGNAAKRIFDGRYNVTVTEPYPISLRVLSLAEVFDSGSDDWSIQIYNFSASAWVILHTFTNADLSPTWKNTTVLGDPEDFINNTETRLRIENGAGGGNQDKFKIDYLALEVSGNQQLALGQVVLHFDHANDIRENVTTSELRVTINNTALATTWTDNWVTTAPWTSTEWDVSPFMIEPGNYTVTVGLYALIDTKSPVELTARFDNVYFFENGTGALVGNFTSCAFNAGSVALWEGIEWWNYTTGFGTNLMIKTRTGNTSVPDASWSPWAPQTNATPVTSPPGRYIQYCANMTTTDGNYTPVLEYLNITFTSYPNNGTVETQDFAPPDMLEWWLFNASATVPIGTSVTYWYSTDSGGSWLPVNKGDNLSAAPLPKVRFRVWLNTTDTTVTPVLHHINLTYKTSVPDTVLPEIIDTAAKPDTQETGYYVNISSNVTDNVDIYGVWVNITLPGGGYNNLSMIQAAGNQWFYNNTFAILGLYQYTIWSNDTSNNWNSSSGHSFTIQDTTLPKITTVLDVPDPQETGGYVNISCEVTDNVMTDGVWINITLPGGSYNNVSMTPEAVDKWFLNTSYVTLGPYQYTIWTNDTSDNWNSSSGHSFTIQDITLPEISNVLADPDPQETGGYMNITCNVTDNINVYGVWVNITYPNGTWSVNLSMTPAFANQWYYNTTWGDVGNYAFTIWANDTNDNWKGSNGWFRISSTMHAYFVSGDITIDGIMDEPAWSNPNTTVTITMDYFGHNLTVYTFHKVGILYVGVKMGGNENNNGNDYLTLSFDTLSDGGSAPQIDDKMIFVKDTGNGNDVFYYEGDGTVWQPAALSNGWKGDARMWGGVANFEFAIPILNLWGTVPPLDNTSVQFTVDAYEDANPKTHVWWPDNGYDGEFPITDYSDLPYSYGTLVYHGTNLEDELVSKELYLQDDGNYSSTDVFDLMNRTFPSDTPLQDYDSDGKPGLWIDNKWDPSKPEDTQRYQYWNLTPELASDFHMVGYINLVLWVNVSDTNKDIVVAVEVYDNVTKDGGVNQPFAQTTFMRPVWATTWEEIQIPIPITGGEYTLKAGNKTVVLIYMIEDKAKELYLAYGNSSYLSRLEFFTNDTFVDVSRIRSYNTSAETSTFIQGEDVFIMANVTDPFGSYDISGASMTVYYPDDSVLIGDITMTLNLTDPSVISLWKLFNYTIPGSMLIQVGTYTVNVLGIEANGVTCNVTAYFDVLYYQPDLWLNGSLTDVYQDVPSGGQVNTTYISPGNNATWWIVLQNDGNENDTFDFGITVNMLPGWTWDMIENSTKNKVNDGDFIYLATGEWSNYNLNISSPVSAAALDESWVEIVAKSQNGSTYDSVKAIASIPGDLPTEISDVLDAPDPQETGGSVNITCNVTDDIGVNEVWVNITLPGGGFSNVSMGHGIGDQWFYKNAYAGLGLYQYTIWANDTSGNWNSSSGHSFTIQDTTLPKITLVIDFPDPRETGGYVNISCEVTDNVMVDGVWVNITLPGGGFSNVTMIQGSGDQWFYNNTFAVLGLYQYTIWANDSSNNWNSSSSHSFTIQDTTLPVISNVLDSPDPQETDGYVNITCDVTDNIGVYDVWLNLTLPGGGYNNISMTKGGGDQWFYNNTFAVLGQYQYTIWINDTTDNWNSSSGYGFILLDSGPQLSEPGVLPSLGDMDTSFNFTVNYSHSFNKNPLVITLNLTGPSGEVFSLTEVDPSDTNYLDGKWYYYNASGMAIGYYSFHFAANDTDGKWIESSILGYEVLNRIPSLSSSQVNPGTGYTDTGFNFTVIYTDLDNHAPDKITVNITGLGIYGLIEADPLDMDYTDGKVYYVNITSIPFGTAYTFHFAANDSLGDWALETPEIDAPDIQQRTATLTSSDKTVEYSDNIILNAMLIENGTPVAGGDIAFYIDMNDNGINEAGELVGTNLSLADGTVSLSYTALMVPGAYSYISSYQGTGYVVSNSTATLAVNQKPASITANDNLIEEGESVTLNVTLEDEDDNGISFQDIEFYVDRNKNSIFEGGELVGSGITDSSGHVEVTYTPSLGYGSYGTWAKYKGSGNYSVTDGYASLTVRNTTNNPPVIVTPVPDQIKPEDSPPWTLDLTVHESDLEDSGVNLTWYLTGVNTSLYTVTGMNSTDDLFTFIPVENAFENDEVTLWLVDSSGGVCFQTLWVNITPVNDRPKIEAINPLTVHYDSEYTYIFTNYISDIETPKEDLVLTTNDPDHTTIDGLSITFLFPESMLGDIVPVLVTVTDTDGGSSSTIIVVKVSEDWVPELEIELPDITLYEGETVEGVFDLDDYFSDPDGDALFYATGQSKVTIYIDPATHIVDMTAPLDWYGIENVTFNALDPSLARVEDLVLITVLPVNDVPSISDVPDLVVRFEQDYKFDLSPYICDEDDVKDDLVLSFIDPNTGLAMPGIKVDPDDNLGMIINLPESMNGTTIQLLIWINDDLDSNFTTINITVSDNYPPELIVPFRDVAFEEDTELINAFNVLFHFIDIDDPFLVYSSGNVMVNVTINPNGSIDFSAPANWSGSENVIFRATDDSGALMESVLMVTVIPVNDAPTISQIPDQVGEEGKIWVLDIHQYLSDVDNDLDDLILSVDSDYVIVAGHTLIFDYPEGIESEIVTVTVSDGGLENSVPVDVIIESAIVVASEGAPWFWIMILGVLLAFLLGILLTRIAIYNVDDLLLITKSGVLITYASSITEEEWKETRDKDIVAAMFVAVQEFVKDAFARKEGEVLKRMDYGDKKVLIAIGNHIIMAAFITGHESKVFTRKMKVFIEDAEERYSDSFSKFKGYMDDFSGLGSMLVSFLEGHYRKGSWKQEAGIILEEETNT